MEGKVRRDSTGNMERWIRQGVCGSWPFVFHTSVSALSGFLSSTLLGCDRNSRRDSVFLSPRGRLLCDCGTRHVSPRSLGPTFYFGPARPFNVCGLGLKFANFTFRLITASTGFPGSLTELL